MTRAEADDLPELADQYRTVTSVDFCYRYYPVVLEMALRIRRGDAGVVRSATGSWFQDWLSWPTGWSWRLERSQSAESNIAADLGSNRFDLVQFNSGLRLTEVMADFATHLPTRQVLAFERLSDVPYEEVNVELEEYAAIMFRLSNGDPGSFTTSQAAIGRKSNTECQVYD